MISRTINHLINQYVPQVPTQHEIVFLKDSKIGDYASNIAFLLSKIQDRPATDIANELQKKLLCHRDIFSDVVVAGRGFINFFLNRQLLLKELAKAARPDFGKLDLGKRKKILVEYISANPTGPLNVVQARAGALGNALVNLLRYVNYDVTSEYYINDMGTQIDLLYESLLARIKQIQGESATLPENGYPGSYLVEIGNLILKNNLPNSEWRSFLLNQIIQMQKESLTKFGIIFDNFVRESSVARYQKVVLEKLTDWTYKKDDALWFKSSQFGDSEDRVLITADNRPTYFLSDLAYHWYKFERHFEYLVNIWGPDHHGYIARMKGGIACLGFDSHRLIIIIAQQVSLTRNNQKIAMSKRQGEFITLDEVLSEIGADALKFFLLMRKASQHLTFDLALAQKTSQENPVYYVQYAHARINSIIRFAQEKITEGCAIPDLNYLNTTEERELIRMLLHYPEVIATAANNFEPHHLIYYALELATTFHKFYENVRVVTDDVPTTLARIYLCRTTQKILKDILSIIGVSAPEKM
ncbi:MAG: arginine--tRNA ligase [candidate division WOR-3 bacterium]|nr:arginine--tRNA ligase [candidate division WOR-3 bacterium]